jgi:lysozyme
MPVDRRALSAGAGGVILIAGLVIGGPDMVKALQGVEKQETTVYADKLAYGIPTVCSGYTDWSLRVGQVYDKAFCDSLDQKTAIDYGIAVVDCIGAENLTQRSLEAMTLFAINVGKKGACGSRAAQLFRVKKHDEACRAISRGPKGERVWVMSGGIPRKGLANRRDFETSWCLKPKAAPSVVA